MKKLLMILLLGFIGCGGEPADVSTTEAPAIEEASVATDTAPLSIASCYEEYRCRRCGLHNRYNQNYLVQVCEDGTTTTIWTGPCGQGCF